MTAITDTIARAMWDASIRAGREALASVTDADLDETIAYCDRMLKIYTDLAAKFREAQMAEEPEPVDAAIETLGLALDEVGVTAEAHEQMAMYWRAQGTAARQALAYRTDNWV